LNAAESTYKGIRKAQTEERSLGMEL